MLRTLHILATGVLLGGHVFDRPAVELFPWLWGGVASGLALLATDLHASFTVILQVRGLLVVLKIIPMFLVFPFWEARVPLLLCALAIGAIGSHMPGRMRYRLLVARTDLATDRRSG